MYTAFINFGGVTHIPLPYFHLEINLIAGVKDMDETILLRFGKRLKALRERQGISQEKFALSIGMDRTYYASVENGKRNISLENINKIANGFGVSLCELFSEL